jgi:hypothetical protein
MALLGFFENYREHRRLSDLSAPACSAARGRLTSVFRSLHILLIGKGSMNIADNLCLNDYRAQKEIEVRVLFVSYNMTVIYGQSIKT